MRTVLWDRVRNVASGLPIPFIGRERVGAPADGEDQLDQAVRQVVQERGVVQEREVLEEPLLQSTSAGSAEPDVEEGPPPTGDAGKKEQGSTMPATIFNLTNTVIGAGIMALPQAVATLGVALGAGLIIIVYILSYVTMDILARASEETDKWTFGDLISAYLGKVGSGTLRFFILINNAGLLITYTIMLGDVLVGKAPEYNGVVTNIVGDHSGDLWYLDRHFVVAVIVVVFLLPLTLQRSLKSLAWAGALGLVLSTAFSVVVVVLVVLAGMQGRISNIFWLLPNPDLTGPGILDKVIGVFSTLPVIALAFVCHYNIHPLLRELRGYTHRRWAIVLQCSLAFCTAVYVIVGVGLYIIFQDSTQSDVLLNFSKGSLGPIVGDLAAQIITYAVWLGYAFNLIFTYPMINWGLREVINEVAFGSPHVSTLPWALVTMAILLVTYAIAMVVPNIWPVMTITGATAAVAIGWIYPALILMKVSGRHAWIKKLSAVLIIILGLVTAVVAVYTTLSPYLANIWGY